MSDSGSARCGVPFTRTKPSTISRSSARASISEAAIVSTCFRASSAASFTAVPTVYVVLLPPDIPA